MSSKKEIKEIKEILDELNGHLKKAGLLEIALVDPLFCIPQKVNARYFDIGMFDQLVKNVKSTGTLESVPLVYQDEELKKEGKFEIISGHHRVDAAKAAGLETILVMVMTGITREELISKQLSHNALTGIDDAQILKELYDRIKNVDLKLASGLSDTIDKVTYDSLNFRVGKFKNFMIMFTDPDIEDYDKMAERLMEFYPVDKNTELRIAALDDHKEFIESIIRIKGMENIKSNAVALHRLCELAGKQMDKIEEATRQKKKDGEKEDK